MCWVVLGCTGLYWAALGCNKLYCQGGQGCPDGQRGPCGPGSLYVLDDPNNSGGRGGRGVPGGPGGQPR